MKTLLENDFPSHYNVKKRAQAVEEQTNAAEFDLEDIPSNFIIQTGSGSVSFKNRNMAISVIKFDKYLDKYDGTQMSDGHLRCDFILTDIDGDELVMCCEITSGGPSMESFSKPIYKKDKNGNIIDIPFLGGKFEKAEKQLSDTLGNILPVPAIASYVQSKTRKICLLAYTIKLRDDETLSATSAFNRPRQVEAKEARENGAQLSSPDIESKGFEFFRINHDFLFAL